VLHVEQHGEAERRPQVVFGEDEANAQQEKAEQDAVVLEVDVVDHEKADVGEQEQVANEFVATGGGQLVDASGKGEILERSMEFSCKNSRLHTQREDNVGNDDGQTLKQNCLVRFVVQIFHVQHFGIKVHGHLGQAPLEEGEKRWIVQCPLAGLVVVPFCQRFRVCDGQPIAVDFEVGGTTGQEERGLYD
jgi:hypothetical protein